MISRSARLRVTPESFRLKEGDRLIFSSDGLVESLEGSLPAGAPAEATAYDAFLGYVSGLPDLPLERFVQALLDRHPALAAGRDQPDDFTVVVVERTTAVLAPDPGKTVS